MPKLIRIYITQVLIGFAISAGFVALLLWANVANLWHLVSHAQGGWLAVVMLWVFNGIVFAGVQFGIRIMRMETPEDRTPPRGPRIPAVVPVRAEAKRRSLLR